MVKTRLDRSLNEILQDLQNIPDLNVIYQISGDYPIFCMAKCLDKGDNIQLLENIKKVDGIEDISTQIVMQRIKEDLRVKVPK